jgi:MerR family transcriptional regulator, Zn(II)-responsive regulator of zntA
VYTIGRLAHRTQVSADSIRFYERQGLLTPSTKTASGYRLYGDDAIRRVAFVKHAQRCGFNLVEIRDILHMHTVDETGREQACALIRAKQVEIKETYKALAAMDEALSRLLEWSRQTQPRPPLAESPAVIALTEILPQPALPARAKETSG